MHAYERHFGFREPPFSVTPDPRFFYASPAYREAYSTLRYGVEARKGFILVTGDAGTGKTTLLRMLMQHADSGIQTAFIFNPPSSFTELLRAILSELELADVAGDKVRMTAQFNDYLLEQFKQGNVVSVLIDEAQTLSHELLEQLRLLSNLEARNAKLVQIVLMGQPELEQKLDRFQLRQLKQRITLRCRIQPLQPDGVAHYIAFRLAVAGYEGQELFSRTGINKIALYSQGIPRLINVLCDNALLRACRDGTSKVSVETITEAAQDLRLDVPPAPEAMESAKAKDLFENRSLSTSAKTVGIGKTGRVFRRRMDWPTLQFGLWFIFVVLVAGGLVKYLEDTGRSPVPVAGDAEKLITLSRNNSALVNSNPSVGAEIEPIDRFDPPSLDEAKEVEAGQSRVVVRLDRDKTVRISARANRQRSLGVFNVVATSLVRNKPAADADIMGSLEPGTRVRVTGKAGDYLRVQGLDAPMISGYVHVEDAFFEPIR